jgi:hypothetical protein
LDAAGDTQTLATVEYFAVARDARVEGERRLVARRSIPRAPEEVVSETWIRIQGAVARRTEPYPDMANETNVVRFLGRVMDNLSRDMARQMSRRRESELVESIGYREAVEHEPDTRLLIEQLVRAVGRRARKGGRCPGCADAVVAAAALEVLHLVLTEQDESAHGGTYIDRMVYAALDRVDSRRSVLSDAARRQRKARCGPCITELLEQGLADLGVAQ